MPDNPKIWGLSAVPMWVAIFIAILIHPLLSEISIAQYATSRGGERTSTRSDWSGEWNTSYGLMELEQSGNVVIGTYGEENVRISGTVSGKVLTFEWGDPNDEYSRGEGEFILADDGINFEGWWSWTDSRDQNQWTGYKLGDREVEGSIANVDYCLWRGSWEIGDGFVMFQQDMNNSVVTGEFISGTTHGILEGYADGWQVNFNWDSDDIRGSGTLTMSYNLGGFTGEIMRDDSETPANWAGRFVSGSTRVDLEGIWATEWGRLEITQDGVAGIINGIIDAASIGNYTGKCIIIGYVVGPMCALTWTLDKPDGEITGSAKLVYDPDKRLLAGQWIYEGGVPGGKLTGRRR